MKQRIRLEDLDCANCAAKLETAIAKLPRVTHVSISFLSQNMILEAPDEDYAAVLKDVKHLIRKLEPDVTVVA